MTKKPEKKKPENKWTCSHCRKRKVVSHFHGGQTARHAHKVCRDCAATPKNLTNPDDVIRLGYNLRRKAA